MGKFHAPCRYCTPRKSIPGKLAAVCPFILQAMGSRPALTHNLICQVLLTRGNSVALCLRVQALAVSILSSLTGKGRSLWSRRATSLASTSHHITSSYELLSACLLRKGSRLGCRCAYHLCCTRSKVCGAAPVTCCSTLVRHIAFSFHAWPMPCTHRSVAWASSSWSGTWKPPMWRSGGLLSFGMLHSQGRTSRRASPSTSKPPLRSGPGSKPPRTARRSGHNF